MRGAAAIFPTNNELLTEANSPLRVNQNADQFAGMLMPTEDFITASVAVQGLHPNMELRAIIRVRHDGWIIHCSLASGSAMPDGDGG